MGLIQKIQLMTFVVLTAPPSENKNQTWVWRKNQCFDCNFVQQKGKKQFHGHRLFHTKIPYPKHFLIICCLETGWTNALNVSSHGRLLVTYIPEKNDTLGSFPPRMVTTRIINYIFSRESLRHPGWGMDPKYTPQSLTIYIQYLKIGWSVGRVIFFQMVLFNFQGSDCWTIKPVPFW